MPLMTEFGIDDMKIGAWTGATMPTTLIDFPARTLSLDTDSDSQTFEADNKIVATRRYNKRGSGSIETASHDPAIFAILGNGVTDTEGTSPNQRTFYQEPSATIDKYVYIVGRAAAGNGRVSELIIAKATITTGPSVSWGTGAFSGVTADWETVGDDDGFLYTLSMLEGTLGVTEIPTTPWEPA